MGIVRRRGRGWLLAIGYAVCILVLLYLGDWIGLEYRVAHGTGYRSVQITQFLSTKLKGQKTEYDMMGSFQQTCGRSMFPQNGNPPCWWLERHTSQWE